MKKKKIKYIVLLIIATVILVADLVLLAMSSRAMSVMPGGGRDFTQNGQMPEGFDPENMPDSFGGGEFQMPEGFDPENMTEGFDSENMPEGFNGGQRPGNMGGEDISSKIGKVRIICIVVAILCALTDIFCIFKLIRIRKEEKKGKEEGRGADSQTKQTPDCPIDPVEQRLKQKKRNRIRWIIIAAILIFIVLILQILSGGNEPSSSSTVKEEVLSAQVENGTIEKTIKSGGVLETAADVDVAVPGNISVTKYLVSNGDFVEEGDPIAVVEKKSVMAAIADLQDVIDDVDDAIEDAKEESITSTIKASVDGTVVAVYAKKGEKVLDIMYEKEALILLSLDDLLAVRINNPGNVNVGDKFTVKDADGNSATGKIAQVEKDKVVVTVSLDKFSYEEEVTVYGDEDKSLGSGKLYIYSQQKITGYSGTISSVKVEKGESVSAGETLLSLSDTDYTAAYENLLNKRIALEEQYNQLVEVGNSGYVYAKEAGTISNIDDTLLVSVSGGTAVVRSGGFVLASARNNTGFVFTSAQGRTGSDTATDVPETEDSTSSETESVPVETISKSIHLVWLNSDGNAMTEGMPESVTFQLVNEEMILSEQVLNGEKEWKYTWTELPKYGENGIEIPYEIKVKEPVEGYIETVQTVDSVTVFILTKEGEKNPGTDNSGTNQPEQNPNGGQSGTDPNGNQQQGGNIGDGQQGSIPNGSQNGNTQMPDSMGQSGNMPSMNGTGSMSGTPNFNVNGGMSSQVPNGQQAEEAEPEYTFQETVICSLSPNDLVEIPITVDELDINLVKEGQKCNITLDAFQSQSFEGVVEDINYSGENSGGNTKYTVTISMEKNADMLLGMNATVSIPISSVSDIATIPVEALVEQEGVVYVYTEYNEKKDELGGLVEIITGVSDGQQVQILSGLETEQKFYYRYADRISYTFIR